MAFQKLFWIYTKRLENLSLILYFIQDNKF